MLVYFMDEFHLRRKQNSHTCDISGKNHRVQQSELYRVYLNDDTDNDVTIFKNVCNAYFKGMPGQRKNDDKPLTKFKGRSIHWGHFSFQGKVKVTVRVNKDIEGKKLKCIRPDTI